MRSVVMINQPTESSEGPWFSFDYKGGSFLCKPAPLPPVDIERVPVRMTAFRDRRFGCIMRPSRSRRRE